MEKRRKHPDALCEECPLYECGYVPGDGPLPSDIIVVAEAPGVQEIAKGRPFTGSSGQLLDKVLDAHGIKRSEVRVTNTCLCRPLDNANPPKEAVRCCNPRLVAELATAKPKAVLALGNFAAQTILDTAEGVTRLRQGSHTVAINDEEVRVIATFHPASCLYNPSNFKSMVDDIEKISPNRVERAGWIEPIYKVFDDETAVKAIEALLDSQYDPLVVDIETGYDKDEEFEHPADVPILCIGISYASDKCIVIGTNAIQNVDVSLALSRLFEHKKLIFHNGKFDTQGLTPYLSSFYPPPSVWFDTMLASYVLDERTMGVHGLEYLAMELLGAPNWKAEKNRIQGGLSWAEFYRQMPDEGYKYNAFDCAATYQLYLYFESVMDDNDKSMHEMLVGFGNALRWSEWEGIKIDLDYLLELEGAYTESLAELESKLRRWVNNPRSWMQNKAALLELGHKVKDTQRDTLVKLLERLYMQDKDPIAREFLDLLLVHKKETKAYGTYVKGSKKRLYKGRLHSTFLIHGTTTGRLSSRNPNLQNVPRSTDDPRNIRRLFVPEEGNTFVQADYKQAELRCIAAFSGDQWLADVFRSGRDLHDEVATKFYGPGFTKEQRVRAKAVVFGLSYGREAFSLAAEYGIPVQEAQAYLNTFFEVIPEVVKWREEVVRTVLNGGDLVNPFGRKRRFWLITRENQKDVIKEAYAFLPQSTSSDITLQSLVRMREAGLHVRVPVHDSILVETPCDRAERIGEQMAEIMEQTALQAWSALRPLGFPVDVKIGPSWGDV